ncbi:DUF371 domain-containing protein [Methanobrevibacter sp. DSM 116169]|uniref:DUF371 domain-containing protein n=1 Tax=Methanobrevibacter sp. DSM 116169 TaxID=3242727 RepID=UPI0038FBE6ED
MIFEIKTKGHENVLSKHKSTFEITKDKDLTLKGDCIIGVAMDKSLNDFSDEFKNKIANSNTKIKVILKTLNGYDEIIGHGHEDLSCNHPTDIVCRKSSFTCSRTLMINSNKAAIDLDEKLINDLKDGHEMIVKIQII